LDARWLRKDTQAVRQFLCAAGQETRAPVRSGCAGL